jgi:hypothetical protein
MEITTHSTRLRFTLTLLFILLFVFFIYTFVHEAGHAITGVAFGQSLMEFDVSFWDFSAHVGMAGQELSRSQFAMQAVAGVVLPLLVWALFIKIVPRKASFPLEALKLISSVAVLSTLLAWIVIPVLYLLEKAPPSDDVTNFLHYSEMQPLLLMVTVFVVYICGWVFFLSKTEGLRREFLLFRTMDREISKAGARTILPIMTGILVFAVALAFLLNYTGARKPQNQMYPPPDFAVVAEIDLSKQVYDAETLAEFTVREPAQIGVFIAVRDINTSYFDLRIVGPNEYSSVIIHGQGYRAERDGGLWQENLLPGTYQLVLTSHRSPGTAAVFLKTH